MTSSGGYNEMEDQSADVMKSIYVVYIDNHPETPSQMKEYSRSASRR